MERRHFLKSSGLAMLGLGFAPGFLTRAIAAESIRRGKVLVVLFQRGGADGLSMVPPVADPLYFTNRPAIAISRPGDGSRSAIKLDDVFGLHPGLEALAPFFRRGALAIVHAVGSTKPTRSHFDAQDFLEAGIPGARAPDGWLNRTLKARGTGALNAFSAIALQPNLPRSLFGPGPALATGSIAEFKLRAGPLSPLAARELEKLYSHTPDALLKNTGSEAFRAMRLLEQLKLEDIPANNGAEYPLSPLGKRMRDIARLIRADIGLEVAATDCGGWDTHVAQGDAQGQLAGRLKDLGDSVAAFATDLGDQMADVCLVTMTEFGRTVRENGNRGTDHGTASVMMVLGGVVRGGRVLARWLGLEETHLFEGRDLAVQTDYRAVLSEVISSHLGVSGTEVIFPGFHPRGNSLGMFG